MVKNPCRSPSAIAASSEGHEVRARPLLPLNQTHTGGDQLGEIAVATGRDGLFGEPLQLGGQGHSVHGVWLIAAVMVPHRPIRRPARSCLRPPSPGPTALKALVGRLVRGGDVSADLLTLVDGPLADAVSKAADYAGKAIAPGTVETYKADWADFARWARQNGVDPAILPVHPVVVAAWLATLAPTLGSSALRRRVAAIARHHRRLGHTWQAGHAAIRQTLTGMGRSHPPAGAAGRGADLSGRQAADRRLPMRSRRPARPGPVSGRAGGRGRWRVNCARSSPPVMTRCSRAGKSRAAARSTCTG